MRNINDFKAIKILLVLFFVLATRNISAQWNKFSFVIETGHESRSLSLVSFENNIHGARQVISNVDDAFHYLVVARGRGDWSLDEDVCSDIHLQGKAIYKYLCTEAKKIYKRKFDIDFYGHKFAIVNQECFNPVNFGIDYHKEGYDGFACFWYANGHWIYSLYNDNGKVDCSEICKLFGGGGHKGAAGFTTKQFISTQLP